MASGNELEGQTVSHGPYSTVLPSRGYPMGAHASLSHKFRLTNVSIGIISMKHAPMSAGGSL